MDLFYLIPCTWKCKYGNWNRWNMSRESRDISKSIFGERPFWKSKMAAIIIDSWHLDLLHYIPYALKTNFRPWDLSNMSRECTHITNYAFGGGHFENPRWPPSYETDFLEPIIFQHRTPICTNGESLALLSSRYQKNCLATRLIHVLHDSACLWYYTRHIYLRIFYLFYIPNSYYFSQLSEIIWIWNIKKKKKNP